MWMNIPMDSTSPMSGTLATWETLNRTGGDNPGKLPGRPVGQSPVWAMDGMSIAADRGPGIIGDTWTIPVTGEYEVARAFSLDTPSRRIHHRSVDTSVDVAIPWALDLDRPGAEDTSTPPLMALHVECNWRLARLKLITAAGAVSTLATIDTRVLQGVSYVREGRYLRANAAGSTVYLTRDEMDGDWTVAWDDGAGTTRYRHLAGCASGRWSNSLSEPRARLELESTQAGDPTGGGTLDLWSPSVTILVPQFMGTALRLDIDSAYPTADGDYRTHLYWCEAHLLAQPPSAARGITAIAGHQRVELEGDLGVRIDRAPAARELRIPYDEGIDESELTGSAVRYVTASTGGVEPAACVGELPRSLVAALERQAGRPVGWVTWDRTAPGVVTLRRAHEQVWGTVEVAPDAEVELGLPGETERTRLGVIAIRQEP